MSNNSVDILYKCFLHKISISLSLAKFIMVKNNNIPSHPVIFGFLNFGIIIYRTDWDVLQCQPPAIMYLYRRIGDTDINFMFRIHALPAR